MTVVPPVMVVVPLWLFAAFSSILPPPVRRMLSLKSLALPEIAPLISMRPVGVALTVRVWSAVSRSPLRTSFPADPIVASAESETGPDTVAVVMIPFTCKAPSLPGRPCPAMVRASPEMITSPRESVDPPSTSVPPFVEPSAALDWTPSQEFPVTRVAPVNELDPSRMILPELLDPTVKPADPMMLDWMVATSPLAASRVASPVIARFPPVRAALLLKRIDDASTPNGPIVTIPVPRLKIASLPLIHCPVSQLGAVLSHVTDPGIHTCVAAVTLVVNGIDAMRTVAHNLHHSGGAERGRG